MVEDLKQVFKDFYIGAREWRVWYVMAMTEIRMRYMRSKLGQFWITLSTLINIMALGFVWAFLWKLPVQEYFPYVTINFLLWGFLNDLISDGCNIFIKAQRYIQQIPLKKSSFAYMNVFRGFTIFLHNSIIIVLVFTYFKISPGVNTLFGLLGLVLVLINAVWASLLLGMIGARFRDVPNLVRSFLQIAFYLTPIVWKLDAMPEHLRYLAAFNPFHVFLSIVRDGWFNYAPNHQYWIIATSITIVGWVVTILALAAYRKRIVFWI